MLSSYFLYIETGVLGGIRVLNLQGGPGRSDIRLYS